VVEIRGPVPRLGTRASPLTSRGSTKSQPKAHSTSQPRPRAAQVLAASREVAAPIIPRTEIAPNGHGHLSRNAEDQARPAICAGHSCME
jgi:hypothetical protein